MSLRKIMMTAATLIPLSSGMLYGVDADTVVAKVNGVEIKRSEIEKNNQIPPQLMSAFKDKDAAFRFLRDLVVTYQVMLQEAKKSGIANDGEVKKQIDEMVQKITKEYTEQITLQAYLGKELKKYLSESDIKKAYDDYLKNFPKNEKEVKALHILVKDEKTADQIIGDLKSGIDFMKLARDKSIDKFTAKNGGEFPDYFRKDDMVKEFSDAAFTLKPGTYTQKPVKTAFGYHIIKVTDSRPVKPKKFDEMRKGIESQIFNEKMKALTQELKAKATIDYFGPDGKPDKAGDTTPLK